MGPGQGWEGVEAQSCPFQSSYSHPQVSALIVGLCGGGRREFLMSAT